eukprot:TRINITY_DN7293_c0_g1_i1.p1 TRINITY_DN7293_c0_g1~~TRINITY_DN7293_c0_g1_i1.p1  ORF type:complete len:263 (-),score=97.93 TRINITY_DN7293_c0_g1_i1:114-902(-)
MFNVVRSRVLPKIKGGLKLNKGQKRTLFMLPQLSYSLQGGLKPAFSARALDYHYNKVHLGYVQKLNQLIEGTQYESMSLDEIIRATSSVADEAIIYNYAAEVWNHNFFWANMTPGGSEPSKRVKELMELHFNGVDKFKQSFTQHARAIFGSGWTWLIDNNGHLEIAVTFNGHTMGGGGSTFGSRSEHGVPVVSSSYVRSFQAGVGTTLSGVTPLLALDVWEHAYAQDYQTDRGAYIDNWWKVVDWNMMERNLINIDRKTRSQ